MKQVMICERYAALMTALVTEMHGRGRTDRLEEVCRTFFLLGSGLRCWNGHKPEIHCYF